MGAERFKNSLLCEDSKITKREGSNAYRLTLPKEMLVGLGWINLPSRKQYKKDTREDEKEKIDIEVKVIPINKREIRILLKKVPEKGFYLSRISQYRKEKARVKQYRGWEKRFDREVKEQQIENKVLENFYEKLKKDESYEIKDGIRVKMNKGKRKKLLKKLEG